MATAEDVYFGLLGIVAVLGGGAELLLGVTGGSVSVSLVTIDGAFLLWRGVIVVSAGAFFVRAAVDGLDDRRNQGVAFLASLMLWIVAGTDVLGRVLGAIPGGGDVWIAGAGEILGSLGPPYSPALVFVVFTLPVLRYTHYGSDWAEEEPDE
ncbi:hypothetical protein [Halanaeroarchaeum sulfurireducens]|uniref:Uncharacterized protein n=1 Tax=Halanaeroarchaeum sulfurireducens TaxID=1604004 RepID=A0A0F7PAC8_9EURY|nr:hypothetical protein [Halanaeroarchaeum sulfurireducens]AKH96579.1 hypothetical protein HLASF_0065 [Halanaeroarchaeum sulfurireducens]ALG80981.1 hypothetical protein HLASA_0065 [Halanaeroarchaeum sulfurireducens]